MKAEEVNRKYRGKYIEIYKHWDHKDNCFKYEVRKAYKTIHENTTLGEDVETIYEYRR